MQNPNESKESFWARYEEARRVVTIQRGEEPQTPDAQDAILSATGGGFCAMLALAMAGVSGERFSWITLAVAAIAGSAIYLTRWYSSRQWQTALNKRLEETKPKERCNG
ncbi:hypothetical protein [Pseudomonas delhiensis]|uniref:hypothetical protein n=1 Tax=Pseudomonas delhiensis TaxID=366289 RepID=UPI00315A207B